MRRRGMARDEGSAANPDFLKSYGYPPNGESVDDESRGKGQNQRSLKLLRLLAQKLDPAGWTDLQDFLKNEITDEDFNASDDGPLNGTESANGLPRNNAETARAMDQRLRTADAHELTFYELFPEARANPVRTVPGDSPIVYDGPSGRIAADGWFTKMHPDTVR